MKLGIDPEELASCVSCGLCLPHCPTYRVTGDEAASPRGRIALMRRVDAGEGEPDGDFARSMNTCLQCRGCEPVCPAGVPFGHLMEATREAMRADVPRSQRLAYRLLGHHRLLLALTSVGAAAERTHLMPPALARRLGLPPTLPLRRAALAPVSVPGGEPVWLFPGCVMDAWQRPVHAAVLRVLARAGGNVSLPKAGADCCGALHVHAGLAAEARRLATRTMAAFPGSAPILVDAAGCGAALQDYGRLLDTDAARAFAARVVDVHTWLAARLDRLPAATVWTGTVAVQDPCHLRHVQHSHAPVRAVLAPFVTALVELDDEGLCCGAGGAYAVTEPELAGQVRERKLAAIARSGADIVASANPGCALHLAVGGASVRHPFELIDEALGQ